MRRSIDDLSDEEIREAVAGLRGTRRIGNRLALALKRWLRQSRQMELLRFRQRWALKFTEYECQGGPLDGLVRTCGPYSRVPTIGGYYTVDRADCRLHFHARESVSSSWMDGI